LICHDASFFGWFDPQNSGSSPKSLLSLSLLPPVSSPFTA
jgi:hypothetical protein